MPRSSRYTDEELLAELAASARRLGRSPTMREFALDRRARPHPQTLVARFGSWNTAKRRAGLVARRFATKAELARQDPHRGRPRPPQALDAFQVPVLEDVRLPERGAPRCRIRRAPCADACRARCGGRRAPRAPAPAAPDLPGLGTGPRRRSSASERMAGLPPVRRRKRRLVALPRAGGAEAR
jgi:hypothetical protein